MDILSRGAQWVAGSVACCLLLAACNRDPQASDASTAPAAGRAAPKIGSAKTAQPPAVPYRTVATVGMVADIVRHVAGGRTQLEQLIGSGVDPHLYKPTRNDIALLQRADVVFYNGLLLEGKMQDVLVRLARSGKQVFAVTEELPEGYLMTPDNAGGHHDPHVWMDVGVWIQAVGTVARLLSEYDPAGREVYEANARRYQAELERLDAYVKQVIGSIPGPQRVLITAHDAFNYFGRAYGIEVLGVQGLSTESEAGLDDINRLVSLIAERGVPAVFVETSVADKNVRALVEGVRARGKELRIGGSLFSDAMGVPGTYEGTYMGMLDHNATVIARALGGEAPAGGMQNRLRTTEGPQ